MDEFLRKRKKGKLPQPATTALKEWWCDRVVWPYPTEDDKKDLGAATGGPPRPPRAHRITPLSCVSLFAHVHLYTCAAPRWDGARPQADTG